MAAEDWIDPEMFGYRRPRRGVSAGVNCNKCGTYCSWKSYINEQGEERYRLMDGKKPHRCNIEEMLD